MKNITHKRMWLRRFFVIFLVALGVYIVSICWIINTDTGQCTSSMGACSAGADIFGRVKWIHFGKDDVYMIIGRSVYEGGASDDGIIGKWRIVLISDASEVPLDGSDGKVDHFNANLKSTANTDEFSLFRGNYVKVKWR